MFEKQLRANMNFGRVIASFSHAVCRAVGDEMENMIHWSIFTT